MLLLCNYYVTYRCNAYCSFCHFSDHKQFKHSKATDLEIFKDNVSQLAKLGVKFIDLTGGEPLLNPNIAEMASYAHKVKMQTSITTNGLLYPKFAEALKGKVNLLHFSLDSPDEDEHNSIRGVQCYRAVIDGLKLAKSIGEYPDILFTVTNDTYKKLPGMYALAKERGFVLIVNPVFSYFGNPGLSDDAIDFIKSFKKGKHDIYLNDAYLALRKNGGNKITKPSCKAVSRVIVISPDNEVILPCYHFGKKRVPIDKPLREIRKSDIISYYKKMEGRFDFCNGCTVNCYFEPSFAFPTTKYGLVSLPSKIKYSYHKLVKQKLFKANSNR